MHDGQQIQRQQLPLRRRVWNVECWNVSTPRVARNQFPTEAPLEPSWMQRYRLILLTIASNREASQLTQLRLGGFSCQMNVAAIRFPPRLRWKLPSDNALLQSCESTLYDEEHRYVESWSRSARDSETRDAKGSLRARAQGPRALSYSFRVGSRRSPKGAMATVPSAFGLRRDLKINLRKLLDVGSERPLRDPGTAGPASGGRFRARAHKFHKSKSGGNGVLWQRESVGVN